MVKRQTATIMSNWAKVLANWTSLGRSILTPSTIGQPWGEPTKPEKTKPNVVVQSRLGSRKGKHQVRAKQLVDGRSSSKQNRSNITGARTGSRWAQQQQLLQGLLPTYLGDAVMSRATAIRRSESSKKQHLVMEPSVVITEAHTRTKGKARAPLPLPPGSSLNVTIL
ncbi:hypothetical protein NL676_011331 [Syzygium grande]|nr:hypothetical protein NL676_011331 [Syzygium grande]